MLGYIFYISPIYPYVDVYVDLHLKYFGFVVEVQSILKPSPSAINGSALFLLYDSRVLYIFEKSFGPLTDLTTSRNILTYKLNLISSSGRLFMNLKERSTVKRKKSFFKMFLTILTYF